MISSRCAVSSAIRALNLVHPIAQALERGFFLQHHAGCFEVKQPHPDLVHSGDALDLHGRLALFDRYFLFDRLRVAGFESPELGIANESRTPLLEGVHRLDVRQICLGDP